jgi:hypothetical protein
MQNISAYSQSGLTRLASLLLRQNHPANADEGRLTLHNYLGVYAPDTQSLERAISDYFRTR